MIEHRQQATLCHFDIRLHRRQQTGTGTECHLRPDRPSRSIRLIMPHPRSDFQRTLSNQSPLLLQNSYIGFETAPRLVQSYN